MSEQWQVVSDLFDRARRLAAAERAEFLQGRCADATVRAEVAALLEAHDALQQADAPAFLQRLDPLAVTSLLESAPEHDVVGSTIGRYRIDECIGAGGMGVVYRAHDPRLERTVALKLLPHHLHMDSAARLRFEEEARTASALDHPNIVTVYEIGDAPDGRLFIAMAYCEGSTLEDLLTEAPLPAPFAVSIARQIAAGLAAAHRRGIVHRDIKPRNIIVTPEGAAKIVDFGIATAVGAPLAQPRLTPGTLAYMSPEQTRGAAPDTRSDVWSFGVVLYEMLSGTHPFGGADDAALVRAIRDDEPPPMAHVRPPVSAALCAVIDRCLRKDPSLRFGAQDLLAELDALQQSDGRAKTRRGAWVAASLALVGLALGVSAAALMRGARWSRDAGAANRVAVAEFVNHTGNADVGEIAAMAGEWITHGLFETGVIQVVPLAAYRLEASAGTLPRALAQTAGARLLLSGGVYGTRGNVRLTATLMDVHDGSIIASFDPVEADAAAPLQAAEELRRRVQSALNARLDTQLTHVRAVERPPRLDAYRAYLAGRDAHAARDLPGALAHFRRAAELDSGFVLPRVTAAIVLGSMGNTAAAAHEVSYLETRHDRLDPFSRAHVDWLRSGRDNDRHGAAAAMGRAARLAPGSTLVTYQFADELVRLGRPGDAVALLRSTDPERGELRGWFGYWQVLTAALHLQGDHRREYESAVRARLLYPDDPRAVFALLQALAARGSTSRILRLADSLDAEAPRMEPSPGAIMLNTALELRAHSTSRRMRTTADSLLLRAVRWYRYPVEERVTPRSRYELALTLAALGRRAEAAALVDTLLSVPLSPPGPSPFAPRGSPYYPDPVALHGLRGVLAARDRDAARTEAALVFLAERPDPLASARATFWSAAIALSRADQDSGMALLRRAFAQGLARSVGLHHAPELEPLRSDPDFRALMTGSDVP